MGESLIELVAWMSNLPTGWAYALILVIAYVENVLPPIPGDMLVVFGGYLAGIGRLNLGFVVVLATLGGTAGFMSMYLIGSRLGSAILDERRFRWLPRRRVLAARTLLARWGYRLVAANRFLSGLRSVISMSVGMAHKPAGPTAAFAAASALVWTTLLAVAGYYLGENWESVGEYLRQYGVVIVGLMVLFVIVQLARYLAARKPDSEVDPHGGGRP
jgi:membrane protein DedA with SNARE-associated domain